MAYTTIDNGEEHFKTILYTGDGSADNDITGVGFAPDWVWAKNRGAADAHWVLDSTRGATKGLYTNGTAAENTQNHLISFDSDGFSVGNQANGLNTSSNNYVAWNWKANGGTTSSNTDGTITSTVQANTTAGFSIVTYTGTGSNATVGHGLGKVPAMIITKTRDNADNWGVYHQGVDSTAPEDYYLPLNLTNARIDVSSTWNDTAPTSSVFSVGSNGVSNDSGGMVAYCFSEVKGYSKFGSFHGNSSLDGPMIYTGFSTKWLMYKNITSATDWMILDDKRIHNASNAQLDYLEPNTSDSEGNMKLDFLSNGFKLRESSESGAKFNVTGQKYIYMAFAEHPFVSSKGVPVTAG
tara:strand:- start:363 stop:1418 length:1056 start_codon:yes stop_codon:yes gene_type:complete